MSAPDDAPPRPRPGSTSGACSTRRRPPPPVDGRRRGRRDAAEDMVGAESVSFLIADFSGESLIRLGHSADGAADAPRRARDRRAGAAGRHAARAGAAPRSGRRSSQDGDGRVAVRAGHEPRRGGRRAGAARSPDAPDEQTRRGRRAGRARAGLHRHRQPPLHRPLRVGPALGAAVAGRGDPAPAAARLLHLRGGAVHARRRGWSPPGEVGGDTFDFSLDRDTLHFSITDAMGHTVNAALLATLLVGSVRNGRRRGADLAEQARLADAALAEHAGALAVRHRAARAHRPGDRDGADRQRRSSAAAAPARRRRRRGAARRRPAVRRGARQRRSTSQTLPLEPGDRLMFLTDGVLERERRQRRRPRRARRQPRRASARGGPAPHPGGRAGAAAATLGDDATALCLDWHGGPPRERETSAGADHAG